MALTTHARDRRVALGAIVAGLAILTHAKEAAGRQVDTLRLADAVTAARSANPRLQVARYRADAARERIGPAGAPPDPMLSFGFVNRPITGPSRTDVQMTMNTVQLGQRFPWPGTLSNGEERARHIAHADELDAEELEAALVARVTSVYLHVAGIDRSIEILLSTRGLLRDFSSVSESRYAVGTGVQQDILQAQIAVARTTADLVALEQERVAAAARLNSLLGRAATVPVGVLEFPRDAPEIADVATLLQRAVESRPALLAARERALAAEAGFRQAQRALYPDITLTLAYGQRPEFVDLGTLMVGVTLPVFSGSKQKRKREEMQIVQLMEEARATEIYNETFARLGELRARAERARVLQELYSTAILPQAAASVESALSAYRVGRVDYMTLLDSQMTVNRFEIERVQLAVDYGGATAEIDAITGQNSDQKTGQNRGKDR